MTEVATRTCAACGEFIEQSFGISGEFCSRKCFRAGRSFCKACNKPLSQSLRMGKKDFCGDVCRNWYARRGEAVSPSFLAEEQRSTCKACGKPITQMNGGQWKQFCSSRCNTKYHRTQSRGQDLLQEWGNFAPEVRRSLREVQTYMGKAAAARLATAIDREYTLRKTTAHNPISTQNPYIICHCKTCGKEFRRRSWGDQSREYCSRRCVPRRYELERESRSKLTWVEVDEIRRLYATGHYTLVNLGEKYDVDDETIRNVVHCRIWKPEHDPRGVAGVQYIPPPKRTTRKLTWEQVDEIRALYATGLYTRAKLVEMYGVNDNSIYNIVTNRRWKPEHDPRHQGQEDALPPRGSGEYNPSVKLTWEQVDEIRHDYATDPSSSYRKFARKYGVGRGQIKRIIVYESWRTEDDPRRKEHQA